MSTRTSPLGKSGLRIGAQSKQVRRANRVEQFVQMIESAGMGRYEYVLRHDAAEVATDARIAAEAAGETIDEDAVYLAYVREWIFKLRVLGCPYRRPGEDGVEYKITAISPSSAHRPSTVQRWTVSNTRELKEKLSFLRYNRFTNVDYWPVPTPLVDPERPAENFVAKPFGRIPHQSDTDWLG